MSGQAEQRALDPVSETYRRRRVAHWENIASFPVRLGGPRSAYHRRLLEIYQTLVAPGQRVLELGAGRGDLLGELSPSFGVALDFSQRAASSSAQRPTGVRFAVGDLQTLPIAGQFDVVILSDLINDLWDVQSALEQVRRVLAPHGRLIANLYSQVWEPPLHIAQALGAATPVLPQNWLGIEDLANLLQLADFELLRHWEEVLLPVSNPLGRLANRYLAHIWPFQLAALTHFVVARPRPGPTPERAPLVSVIVPARNEAGNIEAVFERVPNMGSGTELVFVEGHSSDNTYAVIEAQIARHSDQHAQLLRQTGKGKGDAVRLGFEHAAGDMLMILDADLTVAPEDLPRFYTALRAGTGDFINGVRLVYPMEKQAMRFLNLIGNKFFSLMFSWLLGQSIKDTLCGTKVLWKRDYQRLAAQRAYFGEFDPFGDFDLLFGAAKLNLKIIDMPIRYRERTYGTTNIDRWRHGLLLLQMVIFAARRIKFV